MRTIKYPDDCLFDFPCSPTFRRYEDHLLDRESAQRDDGKTWYERRFDDDLERVRQSRLEMAEDRLLNNTKYHTETHSKLWKVIKQQRIEIEDLRRRFEFEAWKRRPKKTDEPTRTPKRLAVEI